MESKVSNDFLEMSDELAEGHCCFGAFGGFNVPQCGVRGTHVPKSGDGSTHVPQGDIGGTNISCGGVRGSNVPQGSMIRIWQCTYFFVILTEK